MNLKTYYGRIRAIENAIEQDWVVVKSVATESGGIAGRFTEVGRTTAAKMIVEGAAELATPEESDKHHAAAEVKRQAEQDRRRAAQVQFTVLSESDLRSLSRRGRAQKE